MYIYIYTYIICIYIYIKVRVYPRLLVWPGEPPSTVPFPTQLQEKRKVRLGTASQTPLKHNHNHMGVSENVVYPIVPNGFADHYPYEKWLCHWEYTLFSDNPTFWGSNLNTISCVTKCRETRTGHFFLVRIGVDVGLASCWWQVGKSATVSGDFE